MSLNPSTGPRKKLFGTTRSSDTRATTYKDARRIREFLKPHRTQREVAKELNITRQAVELLELSALAKIAHAFRKERGA
jgi:hypothetical protein